MTQTYRTNDPARWGTGQGFNLSPAQVDINFWDLIQRMIAQESRPDPSAGISYFSISGTMMYVHMTDATVLGPYELPVATFLDRGVWAPATVYSKMNTFTINGGLYVVVFDHTSGATFDPGANDGLGNDYYQLMIQTPGSSLPSGGAVGQLLVKTTTADYAVGWGYTDASVVSFEPSTGSTLTASNVADALEELTSGGAVAASGVSYAPSTASGLTSTNVQDALDELGSSGVGDGATPDDANPGMDGTASPGTSALYSRGDHIHPTDTSRAPLASPTFTGVPAAPTAAPATSTTQLATTAFVAAAVTASGGVTPSALTRTNDTNVTLTLGGTPATALLQATSITAGWTGTLAASRGGFGADVSASNGVPVFAAGVPTFDPQLFSNIPQNSRSANYTSVSTDAQKHIFHPAADTTARTFTIDSNANVAYPIGTAITFVNQNAAGVITIAITSDTMRLAGAGTTGSRTLAANGVATALKVTSTEWIISGTGLT